jgi:hypothetical protein
MGIAVPSAVHAMTFDNAAVLAAQPMRVALVPAE